MIKTELKREILPLHIKSRLVLFDEGEYWVGLTLDGGTDFFMFKLIIGNAPLLKNT